MNNEYVQLHDLLKDASNRKALPSVVAYHRIDGPGSSLDLREFQQAFWRMTKIPHEMKKDPTAKWSRTLPRTIGITINTGTKIEAQPFDPELIGVESKDYEKEKATGKPGEIIPTRDNWLLKILDIFRLAGVKFVLQNLNEKTKSAGLGGSSTAAMGVCILANELAGKPLSKIQLIAMASRIEQDFGVSVTGTQEQSNVAFGGVTDYVWFPWGIPGRPKTGYGTSLPLKLIPKKKYGQLKQRMAIFYSGNGRSSTDVNFEWLKKLGESDGYRLHMEKLEIAYQFREGLRLLKWNKVLETIRKYREIRTKLCPEYMTGSHEILEHAEAKGCTAFPLGAGGGGSVLVFSPEPEVLQEIKSDLLRIPRISEICFDIKNKGYELYLGDKLTDSINLPIGRR